MGKIKDFNPGNYDFGGEVEGEMVKILREKIVTVVDHNLEVEKRLNSCKYISNRVREAEKENIIKLTGVMVDRLRYPVSQMDKIDLSIRKSAGNCGIGPDQYRFASKGVDPWEAWAAMKMEKGETLSYMADEVSSDADELIMMLDHNKASREEVVEEMYLVSKNTTNLLKEIKGPYTFCHCAGYGYESVEDALGAYQSGRAALLLAERWHIKHFS